jgi:hypothetical protein
MPQVRKTAKAKVVKRAAKTKRIKTKRAQASKRRASASVGRVWVGTGLCREAQGDGVPCRGTDGECETCGRALR